jgi:acetyl-CoA C-acetyltransferase
VRWPAFARTQVPSVQPESRRGRFRGTVESSRSTVRRMDGSTGVWILGGHQSDFARNPTKEGRDFVALTTEVIDGTLAEAKVNATDIGVVHVGNAFGEMFAGQGHLGAMPATVCDELWDTPASRHEVACASGSIAALSAMADLRSGAYDTALVVGLELEKTVPGDTAAQHLGAAAWTGPFGTLNFGGSTATTVSFVVSTARGL